MAGRTLTITLDADTRRAAGELSRFSQGMSKFGGAMRTAAIAGVAVAGAALGAFAVSSVRAAEEAKKADARLAAVAKSMGLFGRETGTTVGRLQDYASTLAGTLGVEDESIKAVQAKLLTFRNLGTTATEMGGAFDRATVAAYDLAATGFGTAESNATMLGKALENPVKGLTALTRAGVTFTEAETARIAKMVESGDVAGAQALILAALEKQVGGVGAASATASEKMGVAFGEVQEAVGAALLPVLEDLAGYITGTMLPAFQEWWAEHGPKVRDALRNIGRFITDTLIPAIQDLAENMGPSIIGVFDAFTAAVDKVSAAFGDVADTSGDAKRKVDVWEALTAPFRANMKIIETAIGWVASGFENAVAQVRLLVAAWQEIISWAGSVRDAIQGVIDALNRIPGTSLPSIPDIGRSGPAAAGRSAGPVTVNVQAGIGDPVEIARTVERVLANRRFVTGVR